jgi:hypothetical protein
MHYQKFTYYQPQTDVLYDQPDKYCHCFNLSWPSLKNHRLLHLICIHQTSNKMSVSTNIKHESMRLSSNKRYDKKF